MALAEGGAGRTSVLVFTMPFWTILLAWPVLHERLRAMQWVAVSLALAGITFVVEPWNWQGSLVPKLWALLSGFGWAAGTIAMKYFLRDKAVDMVNFMTWQMVIGVIPLAAIPLAYPLPGTDWTLVYVLALVFTGTVSTAIGFMIWFDVLRWLPAGTASLNLLAVPMVGMIASMLLFGERLAAIEWAGIACLGIGLALVSLHAWHVSRQGKRDVADPPLMEGG
jgi:drug/metabolite transporter (DMT)-like permease